MPYTDRGGLRHKSRRIQTDRHAVVNVKGVAIFHFTPDGICCENALHDRKYTFQQWSLHQRSWKA